MEEEYAALAISLKQYEKQLQQINRLVDGAERLCERMSLLTLQGQMTQLIELTKENMTRLRSKISEQVQSPSSDTVREDDSESEAFNRSLLKSPRTTMDEIKKDFRSLEGLKCQAPYSHAWGSSNYHNAIISGVESMEDPYSIDSIQVRVFFTNPVSKEMVPCDQYFLGTCRFSDDECRYSHGHMVSLSDLKEYSAPEFSSIRPGVKALVKSNNSLWAHATIIGITFDGRCEVKFETNGLQDVVDLHHVLPLETDETLPAEESSETDVQEPLWDPNMVERALSNPSSSVLGEWEKHTKGIGSRLMAQMGYVTGSGLGKFGEGRIEPVEAVVLPPGKSLDHCMHLREKAGHSGNLFSLEEQLKKIRRRQEKRRLKQCQKDKGRKDVFSFLNSSLSGNIAKPSTSESAAKTAPVPGPSGLKTQSARGLNVASLQIGEGIRRAERELAHLNESLSRQSEGSLTYKTLLAKQEEKKKELMMLKSSESAVNNEKSQRNDYKKMITF